MNKIKLIWTLGIILMSSDCANCQTHEYYFSEQLSCITYSILGGAEFRDSLADGEWIIYDRFLTQCLPRSKRYGVMLKGKYSNGKRNGRFEYYSGFHSRKTYSLERVENYQNGLLHGEYVVYSPWAYDQEIERGNYFEGAKHGCWLTWREVAEEKRLRYDLASISIYDKGDLLCHYYLSSVK